MRFRNAHSVARCLALARGIGLAVAAIGLLVLLGWSIDAQLLESFAPGWVAMEPAAALAFLSAGVAVVQVVANPKGPAGARAWWGARIVASVAVLIGLATLGEYLVEANFAVAEVFFREPSAITALSMEQMSPLAAVDFTLLGAALLLLMGRARARAIWTAQALALVAAFTAFIALAGYLYGHEALDLVSFFTDTALQTTLALLALSVGVACARPEAGCMALFNAQSAGGAMLRRLLLPVALLPVAMNWLELTVERSGAFPAGFVWMVDAAITVLLIGLLVWTVSRLVHEKDHERQGAEDALRLSEERYRQLVELSPVAIIVMDQHRIEFTNPAGGQLVAAGRREAVSGESPLTFLPPESRAEFKAALGRLLTEGTPFSRREQRVLRLDGEEVEVELSANRVDYHGQRFAQVVARDITERKRAEHQIRLLAQAVQTTREMISIADGENRFTFVNQVFLDTYGFTLAEVLGRTPVILSSPRNPPGLADAILAGARAHGWNGELFHRRRDGTEFSVQLSVSPVRDAQGQLVGVMSIARDITELRRAENEIQTLRHELTHMARVFTIGELTTVLAHELNQPLTAILTNSQAAQRMLAAGSVDVPELQEILADIAADDQRATEVIRRTRAMLRKGEGEFEPVDLNLLIGDVAALLRSETLIKGVGVRLELMSDLPRVRGDRVQLQQVMLNLMLNAIDAMSPEHIGMRRLTLRTTRAADDSTIRVAIEDTGVGIPPDKLGRIFEPFLTSKPGGLGLGLSISRTIIEAHGGRICVGNHTGPGATVEFTLPIGHSRSPFPPEEIDA